MLVIVVWIFAGGIKSEGIKDQGVRLSFRIGGTAGVEGLV
jgi:hypothetical protein